MGLYSTAEIDRRLRRARPPRLGGASSPGNEPGENGYMMGPAIDGDDDDANDRETDGTDEEENADE